MTERVFVDTNVFVYADEAGGTKAEQARDVLRPLIADRSLVVSTQILQEYFVTAIRKLKLAPDVARRRVEHLARFDVVIVRPEHILGAIDLHRLHMLPFWDALVIRCASVAGCRRVLTEDLHHGAVIDGVQIESPFTPVRGASERRARYGRTRPARR